jgi:hypothetical protein
VTNLVLGVLIGLAIALIVQVAVSVWIVPAVQSRIRRHDQWQKDVIDLVALLEDELPRAHDSCYWTSYEVRLLAGLEGDAAYDQDKVRAEKALAIDKQADAYQVLGELVARANRLEQRLRLVHPDAPYWNELSRTIRLQRISENRVDQWRQERLDNEEFEVAWKEVRDRTQDLLTSIQEISQTLKPPPRQILPGVSRGSAPQRSDRAGRSDRNDQENGDDQ